MPLKIRCPHCSRVLRADDDTAGEERLCPACQRRFTVPLPIRIQAERKTANIAAPCPRCKTELAPGTTVCPRCATNVATGKRLPFMQRLARTGPRAWFILFGSVAAVAVVAYIGVQLYQTHFNQPPPAAPYTPIERVDFPVAEWAERLLAATTTAERNAARSELLSVAAVERPRVAQAIATALSADKPAQLPDAVYVRNCRAALHVLAQQAADLRNASEQFAEVLAACQRRPDLRAAAWQTRAALGDAKVAEDLRTAWLAEQRRLAFFKRFIALTRRERDIATQNVAAQCTARVQHISAVLERIGQSDEPQVLDALCARYWDTWGWLGQRRNDQLMSALFNLAKPPETTGASADFEQQKAAIRGARDALDRVADRAAPPAVAAAGLVLAAQAPQYRSARDRITHSIAQALPAAEPAEKQRLTWTLAQLTGRHFGRSASSLHPLDISATEVNAALDWAHSSGAVAEAIRPVEPRQLPKPPELSYRLVTSTRQLEADLIDDFTRGWSEANDAFLRWTEAKLGCTARIVAMLDPGQRRPNYPALAAALALAPDSNPSSVRRQLTLWHEATDQPLWVRQLAYLALGAQDTRTGGGDSGWPSGLDLSWLEDSRQPHATWDHAGTIIAAGGPAMLTRLADLQPPPLSPAGMARLRVAAEEAARRRSNN